MHGSDLKTLNVGQIHGFNAIPNDRRPQNTNGHRVW